MELYGTLWYIQLVVWLFSPSHCPLSQNVILSYAVIYSPSMHITKQQRTEHQTKCCSFWVNPCPCPFMRCSSLVYCTRRVTEDNFVPQPETPNERQKRRHKATVQMFLVNVNSSNACGNECEWRDPGAGFLIFGARLRRFSWNESCRVRLNFSITEV